MELKIGMKVKCPYYGKGVVTRKGMPVSANIQRFYVTFDANTDVPKMYTDEGHALWDVYGRHPEYILREIADEEEELKFGMKVKLRTFNDMAHDPDLHVVICNGRGTIEPKYDGSVRFSTAREEDLPLSRIVTVSDNDGTVVHWLCGNAYFLEPWMVEEIFEEEKPFVITMRKKYSAIERTIDVTEEMFNNVQDILS